MIWYLLIMASFSFTYLLFSNKASEIHFLIQVLCLTCFIIFHGTFQEYEKKLYEIREKLKDIQHSHVWPFQVSISSFSSSTTSESSQRICSSEIQFDSNGLLALLASIGWRQTRLHTCYGNIFSAICMIASAHDHF
jgi:hypothetical protein